MIAEIKTLPVQNCVINNYFTDSENYVKIQREYCLKNCRLKCIYGKQYKKIKE